MMAKKQPSVVGSIKLELKDKLHFKSTESVKLRIEAKCKNIEIHREGIEYCWSYLDSCGFSKEFTSKTGIIMLHCPNFFCGRTMTVKVRVLILQRMSTLSGGSIIISDTALSPPDAIFEDAISFRPTCEKKLAKEAQWLPESMEMNEYISAEIDIRGYNGDVVGLRRMIWTTNEELWMQYESVVVKDNFLYACLERHEIAGQLQTNTTYTFVVEVVDTRNGNHFERYKKEFSVKKRVTVEALDGFPIQPVVVGTIDIVDNNYEQCKYLQADVEYTKDQAGKEKSTVTVFKEGQRLKPTIYLLGGTRKVSVTIEKYTPARCNLKSGSHKNKEALLLRHGQTAPTPVSISVSGETGKIENLEFEYKYTVGKMFKMLFLPFDGISQNNCLKLSTCRHTAEVLIKMYPDIKWEAFIEFGSSEPQLYSHANMPVVHNIFKKHQDKARNAAKKHKAFELSLGLLAEYNGGEKFDFSVNLENSVGTLFTALKTIKDKLDILTFKNTVDQNRSNIKACNVAPKSSRFPSFIDISEPNFRLGGGWQYEVNEKHQLIRKGEIAIASSPLIAVKGGIDLIACSTYIPVVGQVIKAILAINDLTEWLVERISDGKAKYEGQIWFNLYVKGQLDIVGTFEFTHDNKEVNLKAPTTITVGVELGFKAEVSVKTVTIKGETTRTVVAGISGEVTTGITFESSIGYSTTEGMYLGMKVEFAGIILTVNGVAKYEETEKDDKGKVKSKSSYGSDMNTPFPLMDSITLWNGKVFPFKN